MASVSVIIPTLNERANIIAVVTELRTVLAGIDYEIIVVDDDSMDGTSDVVRSTFSSETDENILCIKRSWDRGLSSAVVVGAALSTKQYLCVMDGDGQHRPSDLGEMIKLISSKDLDLVIGSRFLEHSVESMSWVRKAVSKLGTKIAHCFIPKTVTDPLSGFFLIKSSIVLDLKKKLYKGGYKILFDILMLKKDLNISEVKIRFNRRLGGYSKINIATFYHVFGQIIENISRGFLPSGFIVFMMVGLLGLIVHLSVLNSLISLDVSFYWSNAAALFLGLVNNYLLNNRITFGSRYVTFLPKLIGFFKYILANSLSVVANISVASYLYMGEFGVAASAIGGIVSGAFLNYFMSREFAFR